MKVLLTGAGGPSTQALWGMWEGKHQMFFADADIERIFPKIPKSRKILLPVANDNNFFESIIKLTKKYKFDILISQVDEELLVLANNRDLFTETILIIPQASFVETFLDKLKSGKEMRAREIQEPFTRKLQNDSEFQGVPIIFKPRFGRGSRDIFFAESKEEFNSVKRYLLTKKTEFVFQNKIRGTEYSVQMIANALGDLKAIVPLLIKEKRGSTTNGVTDNNKSVIKHCQFFHDSFKASGTYNIQIMLNNDQPYIFEVNPRVSTTMCVSLYGGLDPIDIYTQQSAETTISYIKNGVKIERHWENTFSISN